ALVRAVNVLFERNAQVFFADRIGYRPVDAAGRADGRLQDEGGEEAALVFRFMPRPDKVYGKSHASSVVAESTAAEIVRLLERARSGRVRLDDRALTGGDVAVLVHNHRQAAQIKEALAARGVASVTYGQESVYRSIEAEELAQVLAAVAEP